MEPVSCAGRLAVGGVQVRAVGSVAGVAPFGAVSPSAPDREQHAVPSAAGGVGDSGSGVASAVAEPAAAERGLAAGPEGRPVTINAKGRSLSDEEWVRPREAVAANAAKRVVLRFTSESYVACGHRKLGGRY